MALVWGAIATGLRYNGTRSFPVGLYLASHKMAEKGDLVLVSVLTTPTFELAKARGYMNVAYSSARWIMKRVAAVDGDRITISAEGVEVNGVRLANSIPLPCDGAGRPLETCILKDHVLGPSEVLLMSDYSPASFDSRYFGPLQSTEIESVVEPFLTW